MLQQFLSFATASAVLVLNILVLIYVYRRTGSFRRALLASSQAAKLFLLLLKLFGVDRPVFYIKITQPRFFHEFTAVELTLISYVLLDIWVLVAPELRRDPLTRWMAPDFILR